MLGIVSVPRAYIPQTVATGEPPWRYWSKAGLAIPRGRAPLSVAVPEAWRNRIAISWGNSRIVSSLRIARCPSWGSKKWNAYGGGFLAEMRGEARGPYRPSGGVEADDRLNRKSELPGQNGTGSTRGLRVCRLGSSVASAAGTIPRSHAAWRDQARQDATRARHS